jgi:predicted dehydrogenase
VGIGVGVVGLSHPHSAMHLRTLAALERVERIALFDVDPNVCKHVAASSPKPTDVASSLAELLTWSQVPVVVIVLPNNVTPDAIVQAARAGKHVLCEKPCARSAAELRPARQILQANRVKFGAFYTWRSQPAVQKMRELVLGGAIGRLTSAELRMVTTQVAVRNPGHWLFQRSVAGGGIASWLGCHWLDLLRYTTGEEVTSVVAMTANVGGESIDVEDLLSASLRLSGGGIASLYAGYLLAHGKPGYEGADYDRAFILRGTSGNLALTDANGEHRVILESAAPSATAGRQEYRFPLIPSPAYGGAAGLAFVDGFLDAALTGVGDGPAPIEAAQRVLEILDALYQSAATGRQVDVSTR